MARLVSAYSVFTVFWQSWQSILNYYCKVIWFLHEITVVLLILLRRSSTVLPTNDSGQIEHVSEEMLWEHAVRKCCARTTEIYRPFATLVERATMSKMGLQSWWLCWSVLGSFLKLQRAALLPPGCVCAVTQAEWVCCCPEGTWHAGPAG